MVEEPSICQCRRRRLSPWVGKIGWRRAWQPAPVFLPGESCGQRSLAGCSLWGCRVGRDGARTWGRLPVLCHTLALLFESLLAWPPETAGRLEGTDRPPHRSCGAAGTSFEGQPQGGAAPCFGFAPSTCTCGGGAGGHVRASGPVQAEKQSGGWRATAAPRGWVTQIPRSLRGQI